MLEMDVACMKMLISLSRLILRLVKFFREVQENTHCVTLFYHNLIQCFFSVHFIDKKSFFFYFKGEGGVINAVDVLYTFSST